MLLLLFILIIQHISAATDLTVNATLEEVKRLNHLEYQHESTIISHEAKFSFNISNPYARNILNITSYYFSITFIDEKRYEERTDTMDLPQTNDTEYRGHLKMNHLEEDGNYLICVFFLTNNPEIRIGSSRFCHVVSVAENCNLEAYGEAFSNRHIYVLLIFAVVILVIAVVFSLIRDYVYRPRTIKELLKILPAHHAQDLENLAGAADTRRRRQTQPTLNDRLRRDSNRTNDDNHTTDNEFKIYHTRDNLSLDTLTE